MMNKAFRTQRSHPSSDGKTVVTFAAALPSIRKHWSDMVNAAAERVQAICHTHTDDRACYTICAPHFFDPLYSNVNADVCCLYLIRLKILKSLDLGT